jgi:hypothetical protein
MKTGAKPLEYEENMLCQPYLKLGDLNIFVCIRHFSALLHFPPLKFHWNRIQECCDFRVQTL